VEDQQLMEAVRAGETARLEELFDRYHGPLYRHFLHLTPTRNAGDLAQETFFRVLKYRRSYSPRRRSGRGSTRWAGTSSTTTPAPARARCDAGEAVGLRCPDALPDRQVERKQEAALLRRALAACRGEAGSPGNEPVLDLKYEEIASF